MADEVLLAGAATLPIIPPLGLDMQGFVNRMIAGRGHGEAMEVGAIVVDGSEGRVALVTVDMAVCPLATAEVIRSAIAAAIGCSKAAVLLNFNHSHGLPGFPGRVKLGGEHPAFTPAEYAFGDYVAQMAVSAASLALSRIEPASLELGLAEADELSVNRRERTPRGDTILGWNPDGVCDRSVQTAAFRRKDGAVIAVAVNFACHPVVVGRDVCEYSSDFVGPFRRVLKNIVGGECLFLQGAAGNILPLEGFMSSKGAEVKFGTRLALKAAQAIFNPMDPECQIEKRDFGSTTPISLYRRIPVIDGANAATVSACEESVRFPFQPLPGREELERELKERTQQLSELLKNPDTKVSPNTISYHINWAEAILSDIREGKLADHITAPLQAIRIGKLGISSAPGEIFNEIGMAVKKKSPARLTFYCGYTNGILGYFSTADEYQYGGYEPDRAHRGYGQPAAFHPDCEGILVRQGTALLEELFR